MDSTAAGERAGLLLAPITGAISALRHARMFHPDGLVYDADVRAVERAAPELREIGHRVAGSALVRLSSAWWRAPREWPDVLGMAVRLLPPPAEEREARGTELTATQDLLLATIRFPWTTPFAPLATDVSSFLWNHYYGVSPFDVPPIGLVKLRLRSPRLRNRAGVSRAEHLARAIGSRAATWTMEVRRLSRPRLQRTWDPVAQLTLEQRLDVDQQSLRFLPYLDGRAIRPVGFVHGLRLAAYASSQRARPPSSPGEARPSESA